MDDAILIPILVPLGLFALIFGVIYMKSRENLAMVEKGMNPKEFANRPAPYRNLKWGMLLVGAGLGLFLAYILDNYMLTGINAHDSFRDIDRNVPIYFALIAIGGGLGLIGSYRIEKKELLDKKYQP
jgi:hypothetical protein